MLVSCWGKAVEVDEIMQKNEVSNYPSSYPISMFKKL